MSSMHPPRDVVRRRTVAVPPGESAGTNAPLRVALYSHDSQGLGHVRRNSLLAASLVDALPMVDTLLLSGAPEVSALPLPPRCEVVKVPSLAKDAAGRYGARSLRIPLDELVAMRTAVLEGVLRSWDPHVLIVDKTPRGAFDELDRIIPELRRRGTRTVLGLRDVLDDVATTGREWAAARTTEAIRTHYDQVWVYGDPRLFDPAVEYRWQHETRRKVVYTGYLALDRHRLFPPADDETTTPGPVEPAGPFVLGLVGGGQDGTRLATTFARSRYPRDHAGVLVTGPYAPRELTDELTDLAADRPELQVVRLAPNVPTLVSRSSATVSMGGYNSACELLAGGGPALVVPRTRPRREQLLRAERLAGRGLADMHPVEGLTPEKLGDWFCAAVARDHVDAAADRVDLAGLRRVPQLLLSLLGDEEVLGATAAG